MVDGRDAEARRSDRGVLHAAADVRVRRELYQPQGVPEYRVVRPDARASEWWSPKDERPKILKERTAWAPEGAAEPHTVDPPDFWLEVFEG